MIQKPSFSNKIVTFFTSVGCDGMLITDAIMQSAETDMQKCDPFRPIYTCYNTFQLKWLLWDPVDRFHMAEAKMKGESSHFPVIKLAKIIGAIYLCSESIIFIWFVWFVIWMLWWWIFDGLAKDCGNSSANALELPQSCTKPLNLCLMLQV